MTEDDDWYCPFCEVRRPDERHASWCLSGTDDGQDDESSLPDIDYQEHGGEAG